MLGRTISHNHITSQLGEGGMGIVTRPKTRTWVRNDPDLAILHGHPEFEKLYPADGE